MQFSDLSLLVKSRRSIRKYKNADVPDDLLLKAIDLATWAPNGGNWQPWRYLIIKNRDVIARMADAMDERSRLMASWPESQPYREHADRWLRTSAFFRHAPVCIATLVGGYESTADKLLAARGASDPVAREMAEWRRAGASRIQTIGGAIQTLLLGLHAQGLGACWMAGPQQAKREIEAILAIPSEWEFAALIPVGWPDEEKTGASRKPLEEVVTFIR